MKSLKETFISNLNAVTADKASISSFSQDDFEELESHRTLYSKVYKNKITGEKIGCLYSSPVHYEKDSKLIDQNLTVQPTSYGWKIADSLIEARFPQKSDGEFWVGDLNNKIKIKALRTKKVNGTIDVATNYKTSDGREVFRDSLGNRVFYENAWNYCDLKYNCSGHNVSKHIIIKNKNGPRTFEFEISFDKVDFLGLSEIKSGKEYLQENKQDIVKLSEKSFDEALYDFVYPYAHDSSKLKNYVTAGREIIRLGDKKYKFIIDIDKEYFNNAVFPILLDPSFVFTGMSGSGNGAIEYAQDPFAPPWHFYTADNVDGLEVEAQNYHPQLPREWRHYHRKDRILNTFNCSSLLGYNNLAIVSSNIYFYQFGYQQIECPAPIGTHIARIRIRNELSATAFDAPRSYDQAFGNPYVNGWHSVSWVDALNADVLDDGSGYTTAIIKQNDTLEQYWSPAYTIHAMEGSQWSATGNFAGDPSYRPYITVSFEATPATPTLNIEDQHNNSFKLTWTDTDNLETAFYIDRKSGDDPWVVNWNSVPANTVQMIDTTIYQSVPYQYRVRAYNGNHPNPSLRYSSYSNIVTATNDITAPTVCTATRTWNNQIAVSFDDNEYYRDFYLIERSVNSSPFVGYYATIPVSTQYTKLMLHCNGTNGSTNFIDEMGNAITANGNAQISTSQFEFGNASGSFDGVNSSLTIPSSDGWDFGSGNFTIDFWVMFNGDPTSDNMCFVSHWLDASHFWILRKYNGSNRLNFVVSNTAEYEMSNPWAVTAGVWYHIALVRNGSSIFLFINGISQTLTEIVPLGTQDIQSIAAPLRVAEQYSNYYLRGWIDEFRISKGIARWISNFSVPISEYSDSKFITFYDGSVLDHTLYQYRVRAYRSPYNGAWSSYVNSNVLFMALEVPTSVVAQNKHLHQNKITWTDNELYETEYQLERKENLGSWLSYGSFVADTVEAYDNEAYPKNSYRYRVRCYNSNGYGVYSDFVETNDVYISTQFKDKKYFSNDEFKQPDVLG